MGFLSRLIGAGAVLTGLAVTISVQGTEIRELLADILSRDVLACTSRSTSHNSASYFARGLMLFASGQIHDQAGIFEFNLNAIGDVVRCNYTVDGKNRCPWKPKSTLRTPGHEVPSSKTK